MSLLFSWQLAYLGIEEFITQGKSVPEIDMPSIQRQNSAESLDRDDQLSFDRN